MRRIQTSVFASALAFTLSIFVLPGANAFTIDIDDRSESPFVVIDGTPTAFNDGEILPIVATIPGVFTGVNVRFIIVDPGTTNVSDILSLTVTPGTGEASGTTQVNIEFQSDTESPLTYTPSAIDEIITETGDFQTVYSSTAPEVNPLVIGLRLTWRARHPSLSRSHLSVSPSPESVGRRGAE